MLDNKEWHEGQRTQTTLKSKNLTFKCIKSIHLLEFGLEMHTITSEN